MCIDTQARVIPAPGWHDASLGLPASIPSAVRAWLLLESSVTQALQKTFGEVMHVDVLSDSPGPLLSDERPLLATSSPEGRVRDVFLRTGKHVRVAARTVYVSPKLCVHPDLSSLGGRPLGELLFEQGPPRWHKREWALLDARAPLHGLVRRSLEATGNTCWARRTLFLFEDEPLLVTEMFLPTIFVRQFSAPPEVYSRAQP